MSGHSRWTQIKHKKAIVDAKRSRLFGKLLSAVSVAAREEPNPESNPRLRANIENARAANVPNENISRAIEKAKEFGGLEELTMEAYGPGGVAIMIEAITDNRNRTISETKSILKENGAKWADPGSVEWAFEKKMAGGEKILAPKFIQPLGVEDEVKLKKLLSDLDNQNDIQDVFFNTEVN